MSTSRRKPPPPERFLVFLRHGIAEERTPEKRDEDRGLTATGHERMKEIARGLPRILPKVEAIYTSPLLRAVQTSLWVSRAYRSRAEITTVDALAPGGNEKQFRAFLASIAEQRAILVGHEPDLTAHLCKLVKLGLAGSLELKKGGCYGVLLPSGGEPVLEWLLPPRVLRKLAR